MMRAHTVADKSPVPNESRFSFNTSDEKLLLLLLLMLLFAYASCSSTVVFSPTVALSDCSGRGKVKPAPGANRSATAV
jgi:hypothetical protein